MLSHWEHESFLDWDLVVVGGGLVGLSAALALRERAPTASILVLERGLLPSGATTRSAGFACFGSPSELLADLDRVGATRTAALVARRHAGLRRLRERLGDAAIGYQPCGGFELLPPGRGDVLERLDELCVLLAPILGPDAFVRDDARLGAFGFARDAVAHLVALPCEGALHPGQAVRALQARAAAAGIAAWTGAEVTRIEEDGDGVHVEVGGLPLRAGRVVACTNGFARRLFPTLDVVPGRGQVLVTAPVPDLPFRGVFHLDEGFVYFRDVDGRVLLGGARNLDVAGEATDAPGLTDAIQARLEALLRDVILPGRAVAIERRWSGTMAFGGERDPIVERVSERVTVGVRLGGMGVALGSLVGEEVAALALG